MVLSSPAPWSIKKGSKTVFAPISLKILVTLGSGDGKMWSWNQKDTNQKQVAVGKYAVQLFVWGKKYTLPFWIVN